MRVAVFTVEAPAPWVNSNQRLHRMVAAKLTAAWRAAGKVAGGDVAPFAGPVHVVAHIWKPRGGRYDPNNLWPTVKACVDGLVEAGVFVDDDHLHMAGPDMRHGGKGGPCLVFTVTELGP